MPLLVGIHFGLDRKYTLNKKKTENKYHDVHSEHNVVSSTNMTALFIMQESLGVSMLEVKWVAHGTWWHFQ